MPSRAAQAGPGGFSYYDQVCLAENEKDLHWAHAGRCYRSQVVIRLNGRTASRRRTEAYLLMLDDAGTWSPAALPDGTVSDGKVETYARCIETICGPADTFFTSVFSAQGKRQLSTYRNGEIKSLLADLLGQEDIRAIGQKAGETARQLKAALAALRAEGAAVDAERRRLEDDARRWQGADERVKVAQASRHAAHEQREAARTHEASLMALQEQAKAIERQRAQLMDDLAGARAVGDRTLQDLRAQDREATDRLARLDSRVAQRVAQARVQRERLEARIRSLQRVLADEVVVARAGRRLPLATEVARRRDVRVQALRDAVQDLARRRDAVAGLGQRLASLEREAGQAALQAEDLSRRLALSDRVPCSGMTMQGQCTLLSDAREAAALAPSAQQRIRQLAVERDSLRLDLQALQEAVSLDAGAPKSLSRAECQSRRALARQTAYAALAARRAEMGQARAGLVEAEDELALLPPAPTTDASAKSYIAIDTDSEAAERRQIIASRMRVAERVSLLEAQTQAAIQRLQTAIDALPSPLDAALLAQARAQVERWQGVLDEADRSHLAAVRDAQALAALSAQLKEHGRRRDAAAARTARVEQELANWLLFARCMGNDGLIALAIDDAGPTLSGLVNDLLLACYGPRFTVAIETLQETAKGEQREGFDIRVYDAESGEDKSVTAMSGGERVWISCRNRHEIHYAENWIMPNPTLDQQSTVCDCPPNFCREARHKTARAAAFTLGASRSISLMSGGERTWIDACMTRAIALYLTQHSGRRYATLFSDEADGPLDPEHKRMFMAMKREVLRLGGYEREYFITQTPELAAMADVVIDLDFMQVDGRGT